MGLAFIFEVWSMAALCTPVCFGFGGGRFEDIYGLRFLQRTEVFSQIPNFLSPIDPLIPKRT